MRKTIYLIGMMLVCFVMNLSVSTIAQTAVPEKHLSEGCTHFFEFQAEDIWNEISTAALNPNIVDGFDFPVGATNGSGWLNNLNGLQFLQSYNYGGTCGLTYHPGHDFNKDSTTGDQDRYEPVYAVAEGTVRGSAYYSTSTWGNVILIEHNLPNGSTVWSQYGHLEDRYVQTGATVTKRQQIGRVGKGEVV